MLINDDRYTVPEYNKIHEYVSSGDMWNTVLKQHEKYVNEMKGIKGKQSFSNY